MSDSKGSKKKKRKKEDEMIVTKDVQNIEEEKETKHRKLEECEEDVHGVEDKGACEEISNVSDIESESRQSKQDEKDDTEEDRDTTRKEDELSIINETVEKNFFLPKFSSNSEIDEMFSYYTWDAKSEMKESTKVSAKGKRISASARKLEKYAIGEDDFNTFDSTDVFSSEEINFPEIRSQVRNTYANEELKPSNKRTHYYEVDHSPTIDISDLYEDLEEETPCAAVPVDQNTIDRLIFEISNWNSSLEDTDDDNEDDDCNRMGLFSAFQRDLVLSERDISIDSEFSNEDARRKSDLVTENSNAYSESEDEVLKERGHRIMSSKESGKIATRNDTVDNRRENEAKANESNMHEEKQIITTLNYQIKDNEYYIDRNKTKRPKRDYRECESRRKEKKEDNMPKVIIVLDKHVVETQREKCVMEDERIAARERMREARNRKKEDLKKQEKLKRQEQRKQVKMEVAEFEQLSKKLDKYISCLPVPEDSDDEKLFVSCTKKLLKKKSEYEKKSAVSLSKVKNCTKANANSSYPEFIDVVREMFNVSIKKTYESALDFCKIEMTNEIANIEMTNEIANIEITNEIANIEMTNEIANIEMKNFLQEIINCSDGYFLLFLKSIMTDSLACDRLFKAAMKHLKRNVSLCMKLHPLLSLIVFSNYPKSNCLMLYKFLSICKVIFSVNLGCNYSLPYLKNMKNFLMFSMVEAYHNTDVNQINYTLRRKAARFYCDIISKYYPNEQKNVISYLKNILMNRKSKFCALFGALCAIRAMGPLVEADVIPEIFPFIVLKLKPAKRFTKESFKVFSVKECKIVNCFESFSPTPSELISEIPGIGSPPESEVETQSDPNFENKDMMEIDCRPSTSKEASMLDLIEGESTLDSEPKVHEITLYKHLPKSHNAAQDKSKISRSRFDSIQSENKFVPLIKRELLNACAELTNEYIKNIVSTDNQQLPITCNSISSDTVKMFLDYFGSELRNLIPLKYAFKTFPQHNDVFVKKLMIDLKLRENLRFLI